MAFRLNPPLRQRFGEHLRSVGKPLPGFPAAERYNSSEHSLMTHKSVKCGSAAGTLLQHVRREMRLILELGTSKPRGLMTF